MRLEGARLQFRVELHADEPGVIGKFDDLGQQPVRRHPAKAHARRFQARTIARIDLVAVAMTFRNLRLAIDACDAAALGEHRRVGSEPHGAAELTALPALSSSLPRIHSVIRPTTGSSVGPNSVEPALAMPTRSRAAWITAICIPKQIPK